VSGVPGASPVGWGRSRGAGHRIGTARAKLLWETLWERDWICSNHICHRPTVKHPLALNLEMNSSADGHPWHQLVHLQLQRYTSNCVPNCLFGMLTCPLSSLGPPPVRPPSRVVNPTHGPKSCPRPSFGFFFHFFYISNNCAI
jgi:hypothetical protein